jgi:hypothetical protein
VGGKHLRNPSQKRRLEDIKKSGYLGERIRSRYGLDDRGSIPGSGKEWNSSMKSSRAISRVRCQFAKIFRPLLGLIQSPIQRVPGLFPWGGKAAEAWSWTLTSIYYRGQERVELYLYSTNTPSWRGAQRNHRDNFTFTFTNSFHWYCQSCAELLWQMWATILRNSKKDEAQCGHRITSIFIVFRYLPHRKIFQVGVLDLKFIFCHTYLDYK